MTNQLCPRSWMSTDTRGVAFCTASGALLAWGYDLARVRAVADRFRTDLERLGRPKMAEQLAVAAGPWPDSDYRRVLEEPGYILDSEIARKLLLAA